MEHAKKISNIPVLHFADGQIVEFDRPWVMGIINGSPNSFYQTALQVDAVLSLAEQMVIDGVDIIDVGGFATSPHVNLQRDAVSVQAELDRVLPMIMIIKSHFNVRLSIDTSQPVVMQAAIDAGVDMINDQRALHVSNAIDVVASAKVPVCLMHFPYQREPGSTAATVLCQHVIADLQKKIDRCLQAGISQDRLLIDPGFGQGNYGKNTSENFYLLKELKQFQQFGLPILVGWSRKSMIGDTLGGVAPSERLHGSVAAATIAMMHGANILRVHDVKPTVDAIKISLAMSRSVA